MPTPHTPDTKTAAGWTSPADELAKRGAYDDETVRRYREGLPLSATDKRHARRLIKERTAKQA